MLQPPRRERMLNVPSVVVALIALLALIHAVLVLGLPSEQSEEALLLFAFIPARYDASVMPDVAWPGGWAADIWTFVTYALLHGNVTHLVFNSVWLLAFGSPLAGRLGTWRFVAFMTMSAVAGAVAHLIVHFGQLLPMIGASAAISGAMAGVIRFAFQGNAFPMLQNGRGENLGRAAPLRVSLRNRRVLVFVLVWFAANILFGVLAPSMPGVEQAVAWEAHIGGFLAGLLAFSLFDPLRPVVAQPDAAADKG